MYGGLLLFLGGTSKQYLLGGAIDGPVCSRPFVWHPALRAELYLPPFSTWVMRAWVSGVRSRSVNNASSALTARLTRSWWPSALASFLMARIEPCEFFTSSRAVFMAVSSALPSSTAALIKPHFSASAAVKKRPVYSSSLACLGPMASLNNTEQAPSEVTPILANGRL